MSVYLFFNGHPTNPAKRGYIPGVTPHPGLEADQRIEVTAQTLQHLNRPAGTEKEFAEFVAGVYNANYSYPKWAVVLESSEAGPVAEPEIPAWSEPDEEAEHEVQSEESEPDISPSPLARAITGRAGAGTPKLTSKNKSKGLGSEPEDDQEEIAE